MTTYLMYIDWMTIGSGLLSADDLDFLTLMVDRSSQVKVLLAQRDAGIQRISNRFTGISR